jgi:hypothetical protein
LIESWEEICIKCQANPVKKTGNGRYYNLCPICYSTSDKSKLQKKNCGNKNARYWKIKIKKMLNIRPKY